MNSSSTIWNLLRQVAGGLAWALFLVLAPSEVLLFGAPAWIVLLVRREKARAAQYGFWPGFVCRLFVVVAVFTTAVYAPMKHEDRKVGPLSRPDTTLGDLVTSGVITPLYDEKHAMMQISLPSVMPTRREVMQAITQQTGFKTSVFHCGNGATVLFGGGIGAIRVADRQM